MTENAEEKPQIIFDAKQREAFDAMVEGRNVLLTGSAGTGKSNLITTFYDLYKDSRHIGITSMTGTSAILLNGTTLHSFTGIGLGTAPTDTLIMKIQKSPFLTKRWRTLDTLIIDEISMLTPTLLEKLENIAQVIRMNNEPFGGVQLILSADFLQLPCVESEQFCFESKVWDKCVDKVFYLTKVYRQDDPTFQQCLSEIRLGELSSETKKILKSRVGVELKTDTGIKPTKLFSLNVSVNAVNQQELEKLDRELYQYDLEITFIKPKMNRNYLMERFRKQCRVPETLKLCVGAQVMLLYNRDIENHLVNGSRGVVIDFVEDFPMVRFLNGMEIIIDYHSWDLEENGHKILSYTQVPLTLAWASSIHKTQGQTLDFVDVDLSNVFEHGQAYVALSRVRTLQGLRITGLNFGKIKAHPRAVEFYKKLEEG